MIFKPRLDYGSYLLLTLVIMPLGPTSCGYRFVGASTPFPEGIRTVSSPIFKNRTPEPGLELVFTEAMRQQLIRAGVAAPGKSDAEIQGEVQSLTGGGQILSPNFVLAAYRMTARVKLRLVKATRVLSEIDVDGSEDYLPGSAGGEILESEANRVAALRRLADQIVRDGYDRLATGWASAH